MSVTSRPSSTTTCVMAPQALDGKVRLLYPSTDTERPGSFFRDTSWCQYLTWRCSFLHPPTVSSANVGEGPSWTWTYCPSVIHCVYNLLVFGRGVYTLAWQRGETKGLKVGAKGVFQWEAVISLECILRVL